MDQESEGGDQRGFLSGVKPLPRLQPDVQTRLKTGGWRGIPAVRAAGLQCWVSSLAGGGVGSVVGFVPFSMMCFQISVLLRGPIVLS